MDWSFTVKINTLIGSRLVKTIGLLVGGTGKKVGERTDFRDNLDGGPCGH